MSAVEKACELLKDIEISEDEGKEREKVTKSFLRKTLELLDKSDTKEEYLIDVGYMVARRGGEDPKNFYKRLRTIVNELGDDWRNELKKILEYAVKISYIKLGLGEDICTTV